MAADLALDGLNARAAPSWFDAAKFGVFIHWGLFAIPAFAGGRGSISEAFVTDYDRAIAMTPYTEWYANAIKVEGSPSAVFHKETYGAAPYEAFKEPFLEGLTHFDPDAWAALFKASGAGYVVLVAKHHDGFCLWPTKVANPHRPGFCSERDIVGEVAKAVRAQGLRFGVYYSGGIDWTFNPRPLRTLGDFIASTPGGDYHDYAEAQVRELIARYAPSILWNDISWPTGQARLNRLFLDYYERVGEGVVNDRWTTPSLRSRALRFGPLRRALDRRLKAAILKRGGATGVIPPEVPHSDFRTPEYARFPDIEAKKWEATRGMSHSFGFNRNDADTDYTPASALILDFIDGVAKNGNLLLNVGPMASGEIPAAQTARLLEFGAWLARAGSAVYGSKPWRLAEALTGDGLGVRFTQTGEDVNLILMGAPGGASLTVGGVPLEGPVEVIGLTNGERPVRGRAARAGEDSLIILDAPLTEAFAPALRIKGAAAA